VRDRVLSFEAWVIRLLRLGARAALGGLLALQPIVASAQQGGLGSGLPASLTSDQVQQLLQGGGGQQLLQQMQQNPGSQGGNFGESGTSPTWQAPNAPVELPQSKLEQSFSARAGTQLRQFGYDVFGVARPVTVNRAGAIADSYVLGPNDEIVVTFRGQQQGTYRVRVDRDGRVVLPGLPPVAATGRTFGDFRHDLNAVVGNTFVGTDVFISLGEVRQVSAMVVGEVNNPGMVQISALSTVVDALLLAGGVKQSGSLRDIRLYRGDKELPVDLYTLLTTQGTRITLSVQNGDRILVPPIRDVIAAAGEVRRPGIFELAPGQTQIGAETLLQLAGGVPRNAYRYAVQRIERNGTENLTPLPSLSSGILRGGEILFARPLRNVLSGKVQLLGDVRLPGDYPLSRYRDLRSLVGRSEVLGPSPYLPYAVLETTDPHTLARSFRSFDLAQVMTGRDDVRLKDSDRVFVFSTDDISFLTSDTVLSALRGVMPNDAGGAVFGQPVLPGSGVAAGFATGDASRNAGSDLRPDIGNQGAAAPATPLGGATSSCAGAALLALRVRNNPSGELATGQLAQAARDMAGLQVDCPETFDRIPELLTFMITQSVFVAGDARRPGIYPVADPAHARDVLAVAGVPSGAAASIPGVPASAGARISGGRSIIEAREARVTAAGAFKFPGSHSLASAPTLKSLLGDRSVYAERPYLLFGVIVRRNADTLARQIIPFSPIRVIDGQEDKALQDRDLVVVFSEDAMRNLVSRINTDQDERLREAPLQPALGADTQALSAQQAAQMMQPTANGMPGTAAEASSMGAEQTQPQLAGATNQMQSASASRQAGSAPQDIAKLSPSATPWSNANSAPATSGSSINPELTQLRYQDLAPLVVDHMATITGAVSQPGDYPLMPQTPLGEMIAAAGGLRTEADLSAVEVSTTMLLANEARALTERNDFDLRDGNYNRILVGPRNVVMVRQLVGNQEQGAVALLGEVRHPGHYGLLRNETLTSVLRRAGGLTDVAYPYGAIFTRVSAARAERDALRRMADQIQEGLSTIALTGSPETKTTQQIPPASYEFLHQTLEQLRNAPVLGRISVEANPAVLAVHPELDTLMQAGDAIYYPKRPSTVLVSGEVLVPGSQQFVSGQEAIQYLKAAGGTSQDADEGRAFLLLPNGSAEPLHLSAWDFRSNKVPPGSSIIVPRDLRPYSGWAFATNLTQVLSQVAISAASLAVVSRR
jgi:protein involved in polysaccharide export with SLBB domain